MTRMISYVYGGYILLRRYIIAMSDIALVAFWWDAKFTNL